MSEKTTVWTIEIWNKGDKYHGTTSYFFNKEKARKMFTELCEEYDFAKLIEETTLKDVLIEKS